MGDNNVFFADAMQRKLDFMAGYLNGIIGLAESDQFRKSAIKAYNIVMEPKYDPSEHRYMNIAEYFGID